MDGLLEVVVLQPYGSLITKNDNPSTSGMGFLGA